MLRGNTVLTPDEQAIAAALVAAIHTGDVAALQRIVNGRPDMATGSPMGRTALHVVTDWPGYFPNGPATVALLVAAGANVDARTEGEQGETPLHYAASSDDVDVAEALIDAGADIECPGGSIGTPLENAIGYGCWHVARLLVARGARVDKLWHAAALGQLDRLAELMAGNPDQAELNAAFWQACHGAQLRAAQYLLDHGADINATVDYADGPAVDQVSHIDTRRDVMTTWLRDRGARSAESS
jgi:ankyrin repeat protein